MATRISRSVYADMFGPTSGDRVSSPIPTSSSRSRRFTYGDEVKFGGAR
jgi:urease subunit alpha